MRATEDLFDREDEYDAMLQQGLRLTGEDKSYFLRGRLDLLSSLLPPGRPPRRVLDFGCGTGDTTAELARRFPTADVVGIDTAERAVAHAQEIHGSNRVRFEVLSAAPPDGAFDLCYVNGVFHHIPPDARPEALALIRAALGPEGHLALFENNPWNPGTRLVMSRIPFDRDAITISPREGAALLRSHGFRVAHAPLHLFFFPSALRAFRFIEPRLRWVPLGGQYLLLATPTPGR